MLAAMSKMTSEKKGQPQSSQVLVTYGLFILSGGAVWHLVADGAFSSILTLSVMIQCLALTLLGLQMVASGSAAGISARSLVLDAVAICCRLSSTLWLNGYLPVDATGDHVFQIVDICSLAIILWLLYQVCDVKKHSYQAEEDGLPILPMAVGAVMLAAVLHGNMNGRPIFDTLWMASLFIETIAVLPQLWLIMHTGGRVEALTSHYIAVMAVARALSGIFMWHARDDITCVPWVTGYNHAIWAILGAHVLHLFLLGDFAYYYIKSVTTHGLSKGIEIDLKSLACNV
jgi:hypothetical protein